MNKPTHLSKADNIYASALTEVRQFSFNQQVVDVFPDMINRSVPGYAHIIEGIGKIAQMHCSNNAHIYDLGCSLGAASLSIAKYLCDSQIRIDAVDISPEMVAKCELNKASFSYGKSITVHHGNVIDYRLEQCDMVVLNFTLQFIPPEQRLAIMQKIYASLKPGGVLVLSEKVAHSNSHIEETIVTLHHDFKRQNGYSDLEISQKRSALEDVMKLDTTAQHQQRMAEAGFVNSAVWQQQFNFLSFIAIK